MISYNTTTQNTNNGYIMPQNPKLATALFCAENLGWRIFPCLPNSKAPATRQGFKDATCNLDQITAWWDANPDYNVAVATGATSGIVVVDIDPRNGGDDALTELQGQVGLLDTVTASTGGNGWHYFYAYPAAGARIPSCKLAMGIDIKSDGGYVILAGSYVTPRIGSDNAIIGNGHYEWEASSDPNDGNAVMPIPAKLLPMLVAKNTGGASHAIDTPRNQWVDPQQLAELESALTFISAEGYDDWIKVGMALHSLGNDDAGFRLWDAWSQRSDKYNAREMGLKWRSFATRRDLNRETIFWMAQQAGWKAPEAEPVPVVPFYQVSDDIETETVKPLSTPIELLSPMGLVGDIARYITSTAPIPQPELAVAAALSVCATIIGRKFSTENDIRSNLYLLGLVTTGGGKEHPRKVIKKILTAIGAGHFIGGEGLASAQGLVSAAHKQPNNVFLLDEFGLFLKSIMNPHAGNHRAQILDIFLKMHSAADSIYVGDAYAQREQQIIQNPCVNLFGTSVPSNFYEALSSAHVVNGFLNRMIVCDASGILPDLNDLVQSKPVPAHVIQWGQKALRATGPNGNLEGISGDAPIYIPYEESARELVKNYGKMIHTKRQGMLGDDVLSDLYARRYENMIKIALTLACADTDVASSAVIMPCHVEWAILFSDYWGDRLIESVRLHVADSQHDGLRKAAHAYLLKQGKRGATPAMVANRVRKIGALNETERNTVFSDMLALGMAFACGDGVAGKHMNGRSIPARMVADQHYAAAVK